MKTRTTESVNREVAMMAGLGFTVGGISSGGGVFYERVETDGRVTWIGNMHGWGADVFPTPADAFAGTNRKWLVGDYDGPADVIVAVSDPDATFARLSPDGVVVPAA